MSCKVINIMWITFIFMWISFELWFILTVFDWFCGLVWLNVIEFNHMPNIWNCLTIKIHQVSDIRSKNLAFVRKSSMLFIYISPVSIALSYALRFAFLDNVQFIPRIILSLNPGCFTFWFNPPAAGSWVCVPLTRQPQNPTPRILTSKTPPLYHTHHPKIVPNSHTIQ